MNARITSLFEFRSPLMALFAAAAIGVIAWPGHAAEVEVNVPVVLLEPPTVSPQRFSLGWGGGVGAQDVVDTTGTMGPDLRSAAAAQVRGEVHLGETLAVGLQLTDLMIAGKLKVVAKQGEPVFGKWSVGATARAGSGSAEDGGSTSQWCPGWFVIFPTVASEWSSSHDFSLSDFALVFGRRHSERGLFFGGPFVGSVGYRAHYSEATHECGGGSSSHRTSVEGNVSFRGVNVGYAWQFSRGQLLIEGGVVQVADGAAEDTMLRLNVGGDFFFGQNWTKAGSAR